MNDPITIVLATKALTILGAFIMSFTTLLMGFYVYRKGLSKEEKGFIKFGNVEMSMGSSGAIIMGLSVLWILLIISYEPFYNGGIRGASSVTVIEKPIEN